MSYRIKRNKRQIKVLSASRRESEWLSVDIVTELIQAGNIDIQLFRSI